MDRNVGYRNIQATALCAQSNLLVVGMSDGTIWLRRGLLVRDRGVRQRIMRDGSAGITGLAMQNLSKQIFLFVTTLENVFSYNITVKDKEYKVRPCFKANFRKLPIQRLKFIYFFRFLWIVWDVLKNVVSWHIFQKKRPILDLPIVL